MQDLKELGTNALKLLAVTIVFEFVRRRVSAATTGSVVESFIFLGVRRGAEQSVSTMRYCSQKWLLC